MSVSIYDLRSEFTDIVKGRYLGLINSPRDATDAGLISGVEGPREYQFVLPGVGAAVPVGRSPSLLPDPRGNDRSGGGGAVIILAPSLLPLRFCYSDLVDVSSFDVVVAVLQAASGEGLEPSASVRPSSKCDDGRARCGRTTGLLAAAAA